MARQRYYILEGHEPAPATLHEWGQWFSEADRRVAFTDLGYATVSTVFLGVDHRYMGGGPPILFETMVFANPVKGERFPEEAFDISDRYCTWEEAEFGHVAIVTMVRQAFWRRANGR